MTLRNATEADTGAILDLFEEHDLLEFGRVEMEVSDITEVLEDDGRTWIAESSEGSVIGFAHVQRSGDCDTVAADVELRSRLVRLVVDAGVELGVEKLEHWAGTGGYTGAVLAPFGFAHTGTSWNLSKELVDLVPPSWPAGIELRPEDDADLEQVWQVITRAFADTGFSRERTFEEWRRQVLRDSVAIAVWEGEELVAVATHEIRFEAGYIPQLGVLPSHRGRGLARALLQEAFARDLARGLSLTKLNVDGLNDSARALYDGVGMVVEKEYRKWEKVL